MLLKNCKDLTNDDCRDCISGQVDCDLQPARCNIIGQCLGSILGTTTTETKDNCLKQCQDNDDCRWFTFEIDTNFCQHFLNCPSLDETAKTYISGERTCATDNQGFFEKDIA
jgi:hypothetical protein